MGRINKWRPNDWHYISHNDPTQPMNTKMFSEAYELGADNMFNALMNELERECLHNNSIYNFRKRDCPTCMAEIRKEFGESDDR